MNSREAVIDAMIPLLVPADGITRGQLARKMRVTYSEATRALERLREHHLLRRHLRKSQFIYRLTGSRRSLSVGTLGTIFLN